jgi:FkbM family methyltransferase
MMCPDALTISFEPNPAYQPVLEHLRNHLLGAGQFEFRIVGAGSAAREVTLYIPVVNNMAYYQEASVDMSQFDKPWVSERLRSYGNDVRFEQIIIQVHPLDAYCLSPTIVKIDAEGGEMDALKGMEETINKHRPIFLIENNDYGQVTEYLERFGYSAFRYDARSDQLLPMTGATTNCFYLRPEQQIA